MLSCVSLHAVTASTLLLPQLLQLLLLMLLKLMSVLLPLSLL
jgi:hypothetical protein